MKKLFALAALLFASVSFAQNVTVKNEALGSGKPGDIDPEAAQPVDIREGIYHAPQYMPAYPTAAVLWARVIEVPCTKSAEGLKCDGYTWRPELGRGEYLFVKPVVIESPKPIVQVQEKIVPVVVERKVFIEVPEKRKKE